MIPLALSTRFVLHIVVLVAAVSLLTSFYALFTLEVEGLCEPNSVYLPG